MRFGASKLRALFIVACVWTATACHGTIYLNTSNPGKLNEYRSYFFPEKVIAQKKDLAEPKADLLTIIQYKASQFDGVLADDVSLDIEGLDIGINIRWYIPELNSPFYFNRRCVFNCMIGVKVDDSIYVYNGRVEGTLIPPRGDGFGFGRYFLPDGASLTLGEEMNPIYNARYLAVQQFRANNPCAVLPVLKEWDGEFQLEHK